MPGKYREIPIESWKSFRKLIDEKELGSWAFRGQSDAKWPLYSSLSRYFQTFGVLPENWPTQEERILRIFRRKAHLILTGQPPEHNDSFEWLALMQHHGAPTRLLDFTWSPYVAAFFALERATSDAAVWAVCPPHLSTTRIRTIRASQKTDKKEVGPWIKGNYEANFLRNRRKIVIIGEPHRMNERLVAQSGTFLMPGVLDVPAEQIIWKANRKAIVKLILSTKHVRDDAMAELYSMNITNATLFPGVDGMARSLAFELEHHWAYNPKALSTVRDGFYKD